MTESFREALAESVRDFGRDVVEASGAQEAFKLIGNMDATFLDLKMPGISGIESLREVKPMAPVIALTAFAGISNTIEPIIGAFKHAEPQLRQVVDALANKLDEAINNNDAAAVAALFTEDGIFVAPHPMVSMPIISAIWDA
jgi:CheY-like chemotaxis protein